MFMTALVAPQIGQAPWALSAWLPPTALPVAAIGLSVGWPAWAQMWALAIAIYASLKWLGFASCPTRPRVTSPKALAYLVLWPGMDAAAFFDWSRQVSR